MDLNKQEEWLGGRVSMWTRKNWEMIFIFQKRVWEQGQTANILMKELA